ncbi:MAG: DNA topoisomerase 3 [Christensenellales bacterium]
MKQLIVAEKPSVARDIARALGVKGKGEGAILGEEYVITWALGHLVALCEPDEMDEKYKKWRWEHLPIAPEEIPLKVLPRTRAQYAVVKKWMNAKDISSIICATDAAREGELIFRYIYRMAKCKKPVERLWISSMTDRAIRQGFENLRPAAAYDALYASARCRSEADWIVGMNASRAFSIRYNANLPVGRVQTPTLSMIVSRDREIEAFVPRDYHELRADFGDYTGIYYDPDAKDTKIFDPEQAKRIKKEVTGGEGRVRESAYEMKKTPPPQLFDLTTLQREANRRYGYPADKTLTLAQSLYETRKLLTYPRTDSRYLSKDMAPKVAEAMRNLPDPYAALVRAEEYNAQMRAKRFYDDAKVSDHHAIVPTEKRAELTALPPDERNIYDMVVRRVIAAHYPDYTYESARIVTMVGAHEFRAQGATPVSEGWRAVYRDEAPDKPEDVLPRLAVGDMRKVIKTSLKALKTKPPTPHTDASLLGLMESAGRTYSAQEKIEDADLREQMKSSGLGTPATRAATIERLIKAGYAKRSGKAIRATQKGMQLIQVAPEQITSPATTGKWEKALYAMANNPDPENRAARTDRFMDGIRKFAVFLVDAAKQADGSVHFEKTPYRKKAVRRTKTAK